MSIKLSLTVAHLKLVPAAAAILAMGFVTPPGTAYSAAVRAPALVDSVARAPLFSRDTLAGLSGKLWMKLVNSRRGDSTGILARLFGDSARRMPGVYVVRDTSTEFTFVNLAPEGKWVVYGIMSSLKEHGAITIKDVQVTGDDGDPACEVLHDACSVGLERKPSACSV